MSRTKIIGFEHKTKLEVSYQTAYKNYVQMSIVNYLSCWTQKLKN